MIDGKAKLIRDDYCDGLGNCLPACPADAISFEEREAAAYDHEAGSWRTWRQEKQLQSRLQTHRPRSRNLQDVREA